MPNHATGNKSPDCLVKVPPVMGRPTKLTPALIARLTGWLEKGNFVQQATAVEGIARSTFYYWVERGKQDSALGRASLYRDFLDTIKKAEAIAENRSVQLLQKGGRGWKAHAWWLCRRHPDRWGTRWQLSMKQAREFTHKLVGVLVTHIPDQKLLQRIIGEIRGLDRSPREGSTDKGSDSGDH